MLRDCAVCGNASDDGRAYVLYAEVGIRSNSHPVDVGKTIPIARARDARFSRSDGICTCMCWRGELQRYLCDDCGRIGAQWAEAGGYTNLRSAMQRVLEDIYQRRSPKDSEVIIASRQATSYDNLGVLDLSSPSETSPPPTTSRKGSAPAEDDGSTSQANSSSQPTRPSSTTPEDE